MLADLLVAKDGSRVTDAEGWRRRREEVIAPLLEIEYGRLPKPAGRTRGELLHSHGVGRFDGATHSTYRITVGGPVEISFGMDVMTPKGDGPCPVILNGDACWRCVSDEVTADILSRGYALAQFNRTELAIDTASRERLSGLYRAYEGDYGAIAAWAWGYHRCVDVLQTLPAIDGRKIAVVGHSRGGKASLLAGVLDERIALVSANASGCGGAGSFHFQGPTSETLDIIVDRFPQWFSPKLREYIGRSQELPFDQHFAKAAVAPRALLTTEAQGDLWANPSGTWKTHEAARQVYETLGHPARIGIHFRDGGHEHTRADWAALLDFADWQFRGIMPKRPFDQNPFA